MGGGKATKVVEINPRHPVMVALKDKVVADKESQELKDYANVLFDMALIQSGFSIEEDQIETYAKRLERVVREGLAVSADAAVEPMPEFPDEDEEEDEDEEDEEEELEDEEEEAAEEEAAEEEAAEEKD